MHYSRYPEIERKHHENAGYYKKSLYSHHYGKGVHSFDEKQY